MRWHSLYAFSLGSQFPENRREQTMAGPSSCALVLGMATATAWEPFEWLVRAAPRRATYSDLLGLWPPMKWDSGAGQPGGAAQREGAGLPGQGDGRQGRKRLQHGTPGRSGPRRSPPPAAAAPGGPRPRRTEAPRLGRKQEVPPRGDRAGSPAPRPPHPPATPPPNSRVDVADRQREVPARLHHRGEACAAFVAGQTRGVER